MQIDSPALLDTNILVYAANTSSPFFKRAKAVRDQAASGKFVAYITPQICLEFFAILSNPKRLGEHVNISDAVRAVRAYQSTKHISLVLPKTTTHLHALELCERYKLSTQEVYDAYLIATALDNEIYTIISADNGMTRFKEISVLNPFV